MNKSIAFKLAGAAALAGSTQAYGQIVDVTPSGSIPGSPLDGSHTPGGSLYLDVLTGATSSSQTGTGFNADFEFSYGNAGTYFFTGVQGLNGNTTASTYIYNGTYTVLYADSLTKGAKVGTDTSLKFYGNPPPNAAYVSTYLANSGSSSVALQPTDQVAYLGFQFADSADGGAIHNGYLELESASYVSPSNPGGLIFIGIAYNTIADGQPGGDIEVEDIPEPGTISSLMLGAAALGAVGLMRRRRSCLVIAQGR